MNHKLKKGFAAIFLVAPLVLGCTGIAHAEETFIEIKKEYRTSVKEEDGRPQFQEDYEKDGIVYRLKAVEINNIEEIYPGDIITYDSDPFVGDPEGYAPNKELEKEGKKYTLKNRELTKVVTEEITKYSEAAILYEGVEYMDSLPEDAQVKVINEDLKQELKVTLPAVDYKEESTYWDYNFTFPITVSGYDADSYMLGQTEVSNHSPLIDHARQFLSYLNLPSQYYEITSIEWDGDPVPKNGEMIRNATAHGRKLVKDIRGVYGGDVTFPSTQANVYHGVYVEADSENQTDQVIYRKEATATYEADGEMGLWDYLKGLLDFILNFIKNHPVLSVSIGLAIVIISIILILDHLSKKNKKEEKQ